MMKFDIFPSLPSLTRTDNTNTISLEFQMLSEIGRTGAPREEGGWTEGDGFRTSETVSLPSSRAITNGGADIESRGFTRADVKRCVLDLLLEDDEDEDGKEWKNNEWAEKCFDRLLMQVERHRLPRAFRGGAVASTNNTEGEDLEKVLVVTVEKPKHGERRSDIDAKEKKMIKNSKNEG